MKCKDCIHDNSQGCGFQIDKGISNEYISKLGPHRFCFAKINDFCTADELFNRRRNAEFARRNNENNK